MIWLFASDGQRIRVSSISLSNEYSGLISFWIDWFDFLVVRGTLKSLLQVHNLKTLILWCLAFFMIQLAYLYIQSYGLSSDSSRVQM